MSYHLKRPSETANLNQKELVPLLRNIDNEYTAAMKSYENRLEQAIDKDSIEIQEQVQKQIEDLTAAAKNLPKNTEWRFLFSAVGALPACFNLESQADFTKQEILILITGATAGYFIGRKLDTFIEDNSKTKKSKIADDKLKAQQDACAARKAWLHEVACLENKRLQDMKDQLIRRASALYDDLEEMKQNGEYDQEKVKELTQLSEVYRCVCGEDFYIQNTHVQSYLAQFIGKEKRII
jgi:hypothetical protein